MKRAIIIIALIAVSAVCKAQNDTTLVKSARSIKFETETFVSDKGNTKTNVCCTIDGKSYPSSKSYAERYAVTKRLGGVPNVAIVSNRKSKTERVIVL